VLSFTRSFSEQQLQTPQGAEATKDHVASAAVMERQIARKPAVSLLGGLEGHCIGSLAQEGFDEPLRLAVCPRCMGPGTDGLEIHCGATLPPVAGAIGRTIVLKHTMAGDSLLAEPAHGTSQEVDSRAHLLVRKDLDIGKARSVVDGDMHLLVAGASGGALTAVAGDAVSNPLKPGHPLGVHLDHVARLLPLVPLHRRPGVQVS